LVALEGIETKVVFKLFYQVYLCHLGGIRNKALDKDTAFCLNHQII
jgi:hypothetical protein